MPGPEAIQPSIIEWIKPVGSYLVIPALAIFLKFFFDLIRMVIRQHGGTPEKSANDAETEQRLQHCETGLLAVNSDYDRLESRVDKLYLTLVDKKKD